MHRQYRATVCGTDCWLTDRLTDLLAGCLTDWLNYCAYVAYCRVVCRIKSNGGVHEQQEVAETGTIYVLVLLLCLLPPCLARDYRLIAYRTRLVHSSLIYKSSA